MSLPAEVVAQLKPLAQNLATRIRGAPGDVTAGARQTGDKPGTDRIDTADHNNRDGRGRRRGRNYTRIGRGDEDVHAEPD
jgi:hypothetical protein